MCCQKGSERGGLSILRFHPGGKIRKRKGVEGTNVLQFVRGQQGRGVVLCAGKVHWNLKKGGRVGKGEVVGPVPGLMAREKKKGRA